MLAAVLALPAQAFVRLADDFSSAPGSAWSGITADLAGTGAPLVNSCVPLVYLPSGGNPGEALQLADVDNFDSYFRWQAPLGGTVLPLGASLQYDMHTDQSADDCPNPTVVLKGGGLTLVNLTSQPAVQGVWVTASVLLASSATWHLGSQGAGRRPARLISRPCWAIWLSCGSRARHTTACPKPACWTTCWSRRCRSRGSGFCCWGAWGCWALRRGAGGPDQGPSHAWWQASTAQYCIASMQYMNALLLAKAKEVRDDGAIVEVVIWQLPQPVSPCSHCYKYRLYFGQGGRDRVRYDNERGKGDHRHSDGLEVAYRFTTLDQLLADFERDVQDWS